MFRKTTALILTAVLSTGAAPPARPKPKAPAPASAPRPSVAAIDARAPGGLIDLLAGLDAKAEIVRSDAENVVLKVTSPAGGFQAQFGGCNAQGQACAALLFDAAADRSTATLGELNAFNQSSLTCRTYQDRSGKPHVLYSTLLSSDGARADMLAQIAAWRGCLANFGDFLKDPNGYLASAP